MSHGGRTQHKGKQRKNGKHTKSRKGQGKGKGGRPRIRSDVRGLPRDNIPQHSGEWKGGKLLPRAVLTAVLSLHVVRCDECCADESGSWATGPTGARNGSDLVGIALRPLGSSSEWSTDSSDSSSEEEDAVDMEDDAAAPAEGGLAVFGVEGEEEAVNLG